MTKQEIIAKVEELIAAPSVCAPVKAAGMAEAAKKSKADGGKYCICPACQAGGAIYDNREALA